MNIDDLEARFARLWPLVDALDIAPGWTLLSWDEGEQLAQFCLLAMDTVRTLSALHQQLLTHVLRGQQQDWC